MCVQANKTDIQRKKTFLIYLFYGLFCIKKKYASFQFDETVLQHRQDVTCKQMTRP